MDSNSDLEKTWKEFDEIEPLTPNITKECLDAYKEAAEYDDYMFGNIDYKKEWIGISTDK